MRGVTASYFPSVMSRFMLDEVLVVNGLQSQNLVFLSFLAEGFGISLALGFEAWETVGGFLVDGWRRCSLLFACLTLPCSRHNGREQFVRSGRGSFKGLYLETRRFDLQ